MVFLVQEPVKEAVLLLHLELKKSNGFMAVHILLLAVQNLVTADLKYNILWLHYKIPLIFYFRQNGSTVTFVTAME